MASNQLISPMPLVTLDAGCTITLEAINATSGAAVTGVTVSQVTIYATNAVPAEPSQPEAVADYTYSALE